jgi:hypothetical protein
MRGPTGRALLAKRWIVAGVESPFDEDRTVYRMQNEYFVMQIVEGLGGRTTGPKTIFPAGMEGSPRSNVIVVGKSSNVVGIK